MKKLRIPYGCAKIIAANFGIKDSGYISKIVLRYNNKETIYSERNKAIIAAVKEAANK
jgi:hypothetical protein